MYSVGQCVVYKGHGICRVAEKSEQTLPGSNRPVTYLKLVPLQDENLTLLVPEKKAAGNMREVMSRQEAEEILRTAPFVKTVECADERARRQRYTELVEDNDGWGNARILKHAYNQQQKRRQGGKSLSDVDKKYQTMAADHLYEELAFCLGIPRQQVESRYSLGLEEDWQRKDGESTGK